MPLTPLSHRNGPGPTLLKREPVFDIFRAGILFCHIRKPLKGTFLAFRKQEGHFGWSGGEVLQGRMGSARSDHKIGMPDIIFGD